MLEDGTNCRVVGRDSAPVLVLIHGLGLNQELWQWQQPRLEKKYKLLIYDLYGHGGSLPAKVKPSLTVFSNQLKFLLDYFDFNRVSLIGFSLGGMIARKFAQDFPGHVGELVILNSPHLRSAEGQIAVKNRVEQVKKFGSQATIDEAIVRWFTPSFVARNPAIINLVKFWVQSNEQKSYEESYEVLADGVSEVVKPSPPLRCSTLVISSTEDYGNNANMAEAIASEIKLSEVKILSGLRHMALVEEPDRVSTLIVNFLAKNFEDGKPI